LTCIALVGVWILLASFVRMPGSVLPDLSAYPPWTAALAVGMGALISPLCEQAGIWGYWQGVLERRCSGTTAIVVTSVVFALLPHPPAGIAGRGKATEIV
jgi:membrane protease YdiL (CAAX protease family)